MLRYIPLLAERVTLLRTCPTNRGHDARGWWGKPHVRSFTRLVGVCTAGPLPLYLGVFCFDTPVRQYYRSHGPLFVQTGVCRPADSGTGTTTRRAVYAYSDDHTFEVSGLVLAS